MEIRKWLTGIVLLSVMMFSAGCGTGKDEGGTATVPVAEESRPEESSEIQSASLESLAELLGKDDSRAAEAFGGGEENWTEDNTVYIGRIYYISLFDEEAPVYTTYDNNRLVNSVSIRLVDGERKITEEDTLEWVEKLTEFTGKEPSFYDTSSEAGSKSWKWFSGERAVTLNWREDILTISINTVVAELN